MTNKSVSVSKDISVMNDEFLKGIVSNPNLIGFENNKVSKVLYRDLPVFEYEGRLFNHYNVG